MTLLAVAPARRLCMVTLPCFGIAERKLDQAGLACRSLQFASGGDSWTHHALLRGHAVLGLVATAVGRCQENGRAMPLHSDLGWSACGAQGLQRLFGKGFVSSRYCSGSCDGRFYHCQHDTLGLGRKLPALTAEPKLHTRSTAMLTALTACALEVLSETSPCFNKCLRCLRQVHPLTRSSGNTQRPTCDTLPAFQALPCLPQAPVDTRPVPMRQVVPWSLVTSFVARYPPQHRRLLLTPVGWPKFAAARPERALTLSAARVPLVCRKALVQVDSRSRAKGRRTSVLPQEYTLGRHRRLTTPVAPLGHSRSLAGRCGGRRIAEVLQAQMPAALLWRAMTAERLLLVVASVGLPRSVLSHYPVEGLDHFEPLALIFAGEEGLLMPLSDDTPLTGLVSMRRAAVQVAPSSYEQVRFGVAGIVEHRGLQPFASSEFPSGLCQCCSGLCSSSSPPVALCSSSPASCYSRILPIAHPQGLGNRRDPAVACDSACKYC